MSNAAGVILGIVILFGSIAIILIFGACILASWAAQPPDHTNDVWREKDEAEFGDEDG